MCVLAADVCIYVYKIIALNTNSQGICRDRRKVSGMLEFYVIEREEGFQ